MTKPVGNGRRSTRLILGSLAVAVATWGFLGWFGLPDQTDSGAAHSVTWHRTSIVVGFCFLLFPVTAYYRRQVTATRLLTLAGIGLSVAFIPGPELNDVSFQWFADMLSLLFVMLGLGLLLNFSLAFPDRRDWLSSKLRVFLLYLPPLLAWALAVFYSLSVLIPAVIGSYALLVLWFVITGWLRSTREMRQRLALNEMLAGALLGGLPWAVAVVTDHVAGSDVLPGQSWYFASLVLIPVLWANSAGLSRV